MDNDREATDYNTTEGADPLYQANSFMHRSRQFADKPNWSDKNKFYIEGDSTLGKGICLTPPQFENPVEKTDK